MTLDALEVHLAETRRLLVGQRERLLVAVRLGGRTGPEALAELLASIPKEMDACLASFERLELAIQEVSTEHDAQIRRYDARLGEWFVRYEELLANERTISPNDSTLSMSHGVTQGQAHSEAVLPVRDEDLLWPYAFVAVRPLTPTDVPVVFLLVFGDSPKPLALARFILQARETRRKFFPVLITDRAELLASAELMGIAIELIPAHVVSGTQMLVETRRLSAKWRPSGALCLGSPPVVPVGSFLGR